MLVGRSKVASRSAVVLVCARYSYCPKCSRFCTPFVTRVFTLSAAIIETLAAEAIAHRIGERSRAMGARDRYKRSGLFLVRMWTEEAEDGTGQVECRGKV